MCRVTLIVWLAWATCAEAQREPALTLEGRGGYVAAPTFSSDGKTLAAADTDGLVLWDLTTGRERARLPKSLDRVSGLAFSPDGKLLAVASFSLPNFDALRRRNDTPFPPKGKGELAIWELDGLRCRFRLENPDAPLTSPAFAPDGSALAAMWGWWVGTGRVRLHDPKTGKDLGTAQQHSRTPTGVRFGRGLLVSGGADGVRIWDLAKGAERFHLDVGDVNGGLSLSPNGKVALKYARYGKGPKSKTESRILLLDIDTGKTVWDQPTDSSCLALSPDGRTLAIADALTGVVGMWDAATGKERGWWLAHGDIIWSLAFSPDGKRLATAGRQDGLVKVWDVSKLP